MTDLHVTLATNRPAIHVMAAGSHHVKTARTTGLSASPQGADATFSHAQACDFIDALCAATGYTPAPKERDLDAQRDRTLELAEELREAADDADGELAEVVELALARHVGHVLANAARLIHQVYDHTTDRTVSEMLSELSNLIDTMLFGSRYTNPEELVARHLDRIQELATRLPTPGEPTHA